MEEILHQLRLIVYPIIHRVFVTSEVVQDFFNSAMVRYGEMEMLKPIVGESLIMNCLAIGRKILQYLL